MKLNFQQQILDIVKEGVFLRNVSLVEEKEAFTLIWALQHFEFYIGTRGMPNHNPFFNLSYSEADEQVSVSKFVMALQARTLV